MSALNSKCMVYKPENVLVEKLNHNCPSLPGRSWLSRQQWYCVTASTWNTRTELKKMIVLWEPHFNLFIQQRFFLMISCRLWQQLACFWLPKLRRHLSRWKKWLEWLTSSNTKMSTMMRWNASIRRRVSYFAFVRRSSESPKTVGTIWGAQRKSASGGASYTTHCRIRFQCWAPIQTHLEYSQRTRSTRRAAGNSSSQGYSGCLELCKWQVLKWKRHL